METDSILIDVNQGSMLEQHDHILATVTDEHNTTSQQNNSKDLVSYEEEDDFQEVDVVEQPQRSSNQAPIYMLDLSKVRTYQPEDNQQQLQLSSLQYQGQHSPIEEKDHDYSSGEQEDEEERKSDDYDNDDEYGGQSYPDQNEAADDDEEELQSY